MSKPIVFKKEVMAGLPFCPLLSRTNFRIPKAPVTPIDTTRIWSSANFGYSLVVFVDIGAEF